jgi:hypothetical protein
MSRKITDRASIGGAGTVPAKGVREKMMSSGEGAGSLNEYWDTEDKLKSQQDMASAKIRSHMQKQGYRNG